MKYGALITAAGMSSRMKSFKPLMEIQGMSMTHRLIHIFQKSGIREIVVVTGYQAEKLEAALKNTGVVCIRNENYAATQMFDSVKLGLGEIYGRCDAVFFSPVDVPLITVHTVKKVRDFGEGSIRIPVCCGQDGHPVYIENQLIPRILEYHGNQGLRGAMKLDGELIRRVPVDDPGILMDADTQEDFGRLEFYSQKSAAKEIIFTIP